MTGKSIGPALERQMGVVHRTVLGKSRNVDARPKAVPRAFTRFPEYAVVLQEDLDAATDSRTGATKGTAKVQIWNTESEEYSDVQGFNIEVWNHSESTDYPAGTFGYARSINGHYHFVGDCEPMASWEAI